MELTQDVYRIFSPTANDDDPVERILDELDELDPPDEIEEWQVVDFRDDTWEVVWH